MKSFQSFLFHVIVVSAFTKWLYGKLQNQIEYIYLIFLLNQMLLAVFTHKLKIY